MFQQLREMVKDRWGRPGLDRFLLQGQRFSVLPKPPTPVNRLFDALRKPVQSIRHFSGGAVLRLLRPRWKRPNAPEEYRRLRMGPNEFRAYVVHADGSFTDCGLSSNLLTNIGRDVWLQNFGFIPTQNGPATAVSSSSVTGTGTTWTASALGTPILGMVGLRVKMPVTGLTTAPVYGNIVSNTTSILTIDKWWTAADGTGTTPGNTSAFLIEPGGIFGTRYVGLSTTNTSPGYSDTTMGGEQSANGLGRALGTYAHTLGQSTATLSNTFSPTTTATIYRGGAFGCGTAGATADPVIFETSLNSSASVISGDTLNTVWTFTLSG